MDSLTSQIESLMFASGRPLTFKEISKNLHIKISYLMEIIAHLKHEYESRKRGVRIITNGQTIELVTTPENASVLNKFVKSEKSNITRAQIETLTILGYRGPLSKAELEEIRGLNCSLILSNLKISGLIDEILKKDLIFYHVTTY